MSETKWKKNIKFNEKKEDIAETTIVEGMEDKKINEIEAMEKKIRRINNKKKGFTKLPHLESVYDADPIPNTVNSEKEPEEKEPEEKEPENLTVEPENLTVEPENFDDDPVEPFVEGAREKDTFEKVVDTLIYISILPYHISFLIADGLYKVAHEKPPMSKDDKDYKNLAGMVQRFLTGLIGIFITYNVFFAKDNLQILYNIIQILI